MYFINTDRYAILVIIMLAIIMILINIHLFWTNGLVNSMCTASENHEYAILVVWPWVDAMIYSILPFVIIFVLNLAIVRAIAKSKHHRLHNLSASSSKSVPASKTNDHIHKNNNCKRVPDTDAGDGVDNLNNNSKKCSFSKIYILNLNKSNFAPKYIKPGSESCTIKFSEDVNVKTGSSNQNFSVRKHYIVGKKSTSSDRETANKSSSEQVGSRSCGLNRMGVMLFAVSCFFLVTTLPLNTTFVITAIIKNSISDK
ncbi:hypothetical protein HELRODRAFT_170383 [Helobdella robusta]|uniref:G-protein coupled receptors family 1 profile domain-containing protein n=1 Tax=Helobdella robusta TaxID=6412 RepID=T1F2Z4_HELRO|nr:hypothetical protein HELRODRAFT_170383 [Helobdella robusta]ESO07824.1 hypothetical protein HELRODRAFT_170383 [Helobdella robusta]